MCKKWHNATILAFKDPEDKNQEVLERGSLIPALKSMRQDYEFETSLGNILRLSQKKR